MYKLLIFSFLILIKSQGNTQIETAINWTKDDCRTGLSTDLFDVLENNIVIVQEYIMTNCTPCITVGEIVTSILSDYESLYPGKVVGYQTAHDNYLSCDDMIAWADTNNFYNTTLFNMGADEIEYYGLMGMPTLLVLGGVDHTVFYYHLGLLSTIVIQKELREAIDNALIENGVTLITGINNAADDFNDLHIFPNPAAEQLHININKNTGPAEMVIFNLLGERVYIKHIAGESNIIDLRNFESGTYQVIVKNDHTTLIETFVIQK